MALVVKDRVKETSVTSGTGTLTLAGAATGFQTFSTAIGNTNTTHTYLMGHVTASVVSASLHGSASYALTASYALNGGGTTGGVDLADLWSYSGI